MRPCRTTAPATGSLTPGDLVVLDFGGVLDGYCSDLTRTVSVGPAVTGGPPAACGGPRRAAAAIEAVRPGSRGDRRWMPRRGRCSIAHGLGEAFGHGTGHGLGLDVHEEPRVTQPRPDVPPVLLEPGMVFTIEPGAYLPGLGGVRIEDDVLVTETADAKS